MIRIAILETNRITPINELASPDQLRSAIQLARNLIVDCEVRLKSLSAAQVATPAPAPKRQSAPYLS